MTELMNNYQSPTQAQASNQAKIEALKSLAKTLKAQKGEAGHTPEEVLREAIWPCSDKPVADEAIGLAMKDIAQRCLDKGLNHDIPLLSPVNGEVAFQQELRNIILTSNNAAECYAAQRLFDICKPSSDYPISYILTDITAPTGKSRFLAEAYRQAAKSSDFHRSASGPAYEKAQAQLLRLVNADITLSPQERVQILNELKNHFIPSSNAMNSFTPESRLSVIRRNLMQAEMANYQHQYDYSSDLGKLDKALAREVLWLAQERAINLKGKDSRTYAAVKGIINDLHNGYAGTQIIPLDDTSVLLRNLAGHLDLRYGRNEAVGQFLHEKAGRPASGHPSSGHSYYGRASRKSRWTIWRQTSRQNR